MQPVNDAIAAFKSRFAGAPIAVTEPVANELLEAAGVAIRTPFSLQAAIMNGTDPSPQDVSAQDALFSTHAVKVFVYNQQVTDALTNSFIALARKNSIPVVGVYETMPTPGFTYQTWMMAELDALRAALAGGRSTETLEPTK
jgi:zinc/manganese transport system substrate-binding protein